jgi:hypothetical protein
LTTDITAIEQISQSVPGEYRLYNNYPNPFNPSTTIKFDLQSAGYVKLEIFNSTGNAVLSENFPALNAGSYEYEFNASELPSGAYFYRLTAMNNFSPSSNMLAFIQTKKMILVK